MKSYSLILVAALLLIAGGTYFYMSHRSSTEVACTAEAMICPDGSAVGRTGPNCSFAPCPTVSDGYKNTTYTIEGNAVTLKNGVSRVPVAIDSASMVTTTYFGNDLRADLNGDGIVDVAFIVTQNSGGSGTFYYLVGATKDAQGQYHGTDGVLLGDRIAPQTIEVSKNPLQKNVIVVNYADRARGQPMTVQPTVGKSLYLKLDAASMQWGVVEPNFEGEAR